MILSQKLDYDIIFPFYNDFNFLKRSLESINKQTLLPKNLIFIDDGNNKQNLQSDVSNLLLSKINLIFISFKKNKGNILGVSEGFKYVKNKFFFIMASDDIYYENLALNSLTKLCKYEQAGFVFSNIISNYSDLGTKKKIKFLFLKKDIYDPEESRSILKYKKLKIYHNTVFYRTNYFKKNNYFKKSIGPRCDFFNLIFFASNYGFAYVDEYLSEFTIRKGQINKYYDDEYLINEIKLIHKEFFELYSLTKSLDMFFDLSPFSLLSIWKTNIKDIFSLNLLKKSIYFYIWKKLRKFFPDFIIQFFYKLIN